MPSDEDEVPTDAAAEDAVLPEDEAEDDTGAALSGHLGELLSRLEEEVEEVDDIVEEASSIIVEGTAAGGAVVVNITGALEAVAVQIDPALVDPSDVAMLEDAVLAALRDALAQVRVLQRELAGTLEDAEVDLSTLLGNLGNLGNLGGLGLPDFGNLANPEDLLAGLSGALANLTGGAGFGAVGGLEGLSDLMAGLGPMSHLPAGADEGDTSTDAAARQQMSEQSDDDDEAASEDP